MKFNTQRDIAPDVTLEFEWHGGAYIDVKASGMPHPMEVINVWNAYSDTPRIERTQEAFEKKVDEWIENYPSYSLLHDVLHNWS